MHSMLDMAHAFAYKKETISESIPVSFYVGTMRNWFILLLINSHFGFTCWCILLSIDIQIWLTMFGSFAALSPCFWKLAKKPGNYSNRKLLLMMKHLITRIQMESKSCFKLLHSFDRMHWRYKLLTLYIVVTYSKSGNEYLDSKQ